MTRAEDLLPADEQLRLEECVREPLHLSGAVQPHGALVAVDAGTLEITHVSANSGRLLGAEPPSLLGRPLADLLGVDVSAALHAAGFDRTADAVNPTRVTIGGRSFDAVVHRSGGSGVIDLEPAAPVDERLLPRLHAALRRLAACPTVPDLRAAAAREMRALTGYDRVMVYRFHEDGHGEVVAEEREADLEPFLGLHYPASDVPAQARALYVQQGSRHIVTAPEPAVPLVGGSAVPLDLGLAELRSVSPHHLTFMANMGVAASVAFPLVKDGELVGMISCNDRVARHVPYAVRRVGEILAQQVILTTSAMETTDRLTRDLAFSSLRARLVEQMIGSEDAAVALVDGAVGVRDLVAADGAAVRLDGRLVLTGRTPSAEQVEAAAALVTVDSTPGSPGLLVTDALSADRPDLAQALTDVAGLLLVPFGGDGDYLAWFRTEVVQTVDWLGDQTAANRATPLSPRSSFDLWRQSVRGRSLAWEELEVQQAEELRRDVDNVLLHRAEARLAHLGLHDALTGLPNRRLLLDRLEHALERHARGEPVALLFIDLDRFKLVNDSYGHDVGDQLLVGAARRLRDVTRDSDTLARLGGDEFVVLCEDTEAADAGLLADRVITAFQAPVQLDGHAFWLTASVGVTTASSHSRPADLLREADTAMYLAKDRGRNRSSRFEAGLRYQAVRRLDTEEALRRGLDRGELLLHHQPITDLATGRVRGVEALVRWDRPGRGLTPPDEFLPLAEDNGLIVPLGAEVLRQALGQLREWRRAGVVAADFTVAVNVSPRQLLEADLVGTVRDALADAGLGPRDLVLEMTETTLMSERSTMADAVSGLADLGVALSIDDFGTGYSSLSYLRYLPVSELKIDRSFVSTLSDSSQDTALVAAVVGLAHEFGMTCVAEGVETAAQLERLRALGCDAAQGYWIGRPAPAHVLTQAWAGPAA